MVNNRFFIDRKEAAAKLNSAYRKEPRLVFWFAARCALRIFPLLTYKHGLGYWKVGSHENKIDRSIKNLAAVWRMLLISVCASREKNFPANRVYGAATAANAIAYADASANNTVAAYVVDAIDGAAYAAAYDEVGSATSALAALSNAVSVAPLGSSLVTQYIDQVSHDLKQIEEVNHVDQLKNIALWQFDIVGKDAAINLVNKSIPNVIGRLLVEYGKDLDLSVVEFLKGIYPGYQKIISADYRVDSLVEGGRIYDDQFYSDLPVFEDGSNSLKPSSKRRGRPDHRLRQDDLKGDDALNRVQLSLSLSRLLLAKENSGHFAIGLLGEWGAGKSFLLELLKKNILNRSQNVEFLIGSFNAWAYEQADNLQAGVTQEAIVGLTEKMSFIEKLFLAFRFSWRYSPLKVIIIALFFLFALLGLTPLYFYREQLLNWLVGLSIVVSLGSFIEFYKLCKGLLSYPLAKNFQTYLNLPSYGEHLGQIPIMQQQIKTMCDLRLGHYDPKDENKQRRLLYIVDDLDRCSPEGILKTLEAVRLMMDIPQVTVIIAVDHRIALAALAYHYKELARYQVGRPDRAIARDYLGKIIQLPITLIKPDHGIVDSYVTKQLLAMDKDIKTLDEILAIVNIPDYVWEMPAADPTGTSAPTASSSATTLGQQVVNRPKESDRKKSITVVSSETPASEAGAANVDGGRAPERPVMPPQLSAAFRYWVHSFQLHNPRQIKRLYNSYNLIWRYYGETEEPRTEHVYSYCQMLGLILLDYLNTLPSSQRTTLKKFLNEGIESEEEFKELGKAHWVQVSGILSAQPRWRQEVEPFVLPALDAVEQGGSNNEPAVSA